MHAIEGIFGFFVPAHPLSSQDFTNAGLVFDEKRYCEPFITDDLLYASFGDATEWVRQQFFNGHSFKPEFDTQAKIAAYASQHPLDGYIRQQLFDLLADVILFRDPKQDGHYHFRIDIYDTQSYNRLSQDEKEKLGRLYTHYFYEKQNGLWYQVARQKLDAIQQSSNMLICAEDLGMVPDMVEGVLKSREMLALQVQRMPKKSHQQFSHPLDAPYLSVVTPSTHDMSTLRQWWEEDGHLTQRFYQEQLGRTGAAPRFCEPDICKAIIRQHLESPAMWSVFLLQDLLSIDSELRRQLPDEERINNPADPHHYWNYRMHVTIETLLARESLSSSIHQMISDTDRC